MYHLNYLYPLPANTIIGTVAANFRTHRILFTITLNDELVDFLSQQLLAITPAAL